MDKRRNCSSGAISPLFHNSFNIYILCKGDKFHMNLGNLVVRFFSQFCKSDMWNYGYLDVFQRVPWSSRYREPTVASIKLMFCFFDIEFKYGHTRLSHFR